MNIKHLEVKRAYYNDPENVVVQYLRTAHGATFFTDCDGEPLWHEDTDYRIKPKTIRIGDLDVPEPVREALKNGQEYFIASIGGKSFGGKDTWKGDEYDNRWLSRGLIHLTSEAAELHAKALILVSGGKINE